LKSVTSKLRYFVWKFCSVLNVTGRERQPFEVEVHLLQGVNEDNVEPTSSIDEGLREQGALNYGLNDEWVRPRIWDVNC
jgi:hypothetical protein